MLALLHSTQILVRTRVTWPVLEKKVSMRLHSTSQESRLATKRRMMMGGGSLSGRSTSGRREPRVSVLNSSGGGHESKGPVNSGGSGKKAKPNSDVHNHSVSPAAVKKDMSLLRKSLLARPNMRDEGRLPRLGSSAWNMQSMQQVRAPLHSTKSRNHMVDTNHSTKPSTETKLKLSLSGREARKAKSNGEGGTMAMTDIETRMERLEAGQMEMQKLLKALMEKVDKK